MGKIMINGESYPSYVVKTGVDDTGIFEDKAWSSKKTSDEIAEVETALPNIKKFASPSGTARYITISGATLGDIEVHSAYAGKYMFTSTGTKPIFFGTSTYLGYTLTGWAWSSDKTKLYLRVNGQRDFVISAFGSDGVEISDMTTTAPTDVTFNATFNYNAYIDNSTSENTSTYSSAKIDEKYGAYTFGTADAKQWLKLTLGNSSKFQPIVISDQYGGKVEITGMADDGTYKSVKLVRYSYGDWTTYSATDYTLYDGVDPNYKIQRLFYYPTNGCYYLEIRQWCTIKVSGAISKPEMVTSLPVETSAMTLIPESQFASKSDLTTKQDNLSMKKAFIRRNASTSQYCLLATIDLRTLNQLMQPLRLKGVIGNMANEIVNVDITINGRQGFTPTMLFGTITSKGGILTNYANILINKSDDEQTAYVYMHFKYSYAYCDLEVYLGSSQYEVPPFRLTDTMQGTTYTNLLDNTNVVAEAVINDSSTGDTTSTWSSSKIASEINPTIDTSKVFSNGALNIATLCSTYGNGRYVIVGQGTAGNGSATIDIWTLASNAISYIVNVTYSNKTSNTFIGLTYENPTINFETGYLSACNHIAKVCTLA